VSQTQRVLITGGTGFVGQHLQEELRDRNIPFASYGKRNYDLTERSESEAMFAANSKVEYIIHLASYQAAADFPALHPGEQFAINNLIHINVLEGWRKFAPQAKLFAIGSSCAYPGNATNLVEEVFLDGEIHGSVYSYAFTKRLLRIGIQAYNDQFRLNGNYIIPCTMFGEYDDFNVSTAHVSGALVGKFCRAAREGGDVEIWGDGSQIRDFMYVKDFVKILVELLSDSNQDIINIGPGSGTSIKDLAYMIKESAGFAGTIKFNEASYTGVREKTINVSKLTEKYKLKCPHDISGAIRKTCEWYLRNYDELKNKRKFPEPGYEQ
jgi:GDP-L-fucose synthase